MDLDGEVVEGVLRFVGVIVGAGMEVLGQGIQNAADSNGDDGSGWDTAGRLIEGLGKELGDACKE